MERDTSTDQNSIPTTVIFTRLLSKNSHILTPRASRDNILAAIAEQKSNRDSKVNPSIGASSNSPFGKPKIK